MKATMAIAILVMLAAAPAHAQGPAYPTPDNNLTRSDDVDPADAPNLNQEYGQPSDLIPDDDEDGYAADDFGDDDDDDDDFVEGPQHYDRRE